MGTYAYLLVKSKQISINRSVLSIYRYLFLLIYQCKWCLNSGLTSAREHGRKRLHSCALVILSGPIFHARVTSYSQSLAHHQTDSLQKLMRLSLQKSHPSCFWNRRWGNMKKTIPVLLLNAPCWWSIHSSYPLLLQPTHQLDLINKGRVILF